MQIDCESRIETLTSLNKDLDSQLLDLTEQLEKAKLETVTDCHFAILSKNDYK